MHGRKTHEKREEISFLQRHTQKKFVFVLTFLNSMLAHAKEVSISGELPDLSGILVMNHL